MPFFTDQTGSIIEINETPKRIVSIVPSQTELLADLGLDEEVIGITKFCVHPQNWFKSKTRIGGTKNIRIDILHSLKPDIVIGNKEENVKEQVEEIRKHYPVWISDVNRLRDAYDMIESIGTITNTSTKAGLLVDKIKEKFRKLALSTSKIHAQISVAYLIWKDPHMAAGGDTFIQDMMSRCRFKNIFEYIPRYPVITMEDIKDARCELLLLSSEPFPFDQKHLESFQEEIPDANILLVNGEMFSWYGSRLQYAPAYFENVLRRSGYAL